MVSLWFIQTPRERVFSELFGYFLNYRKMKHFVVAGGEN